MDFFYSYIALAEIYVLLGLSTNLLVGIVGIFSVSQAAIFGVGAYVVAYLLMNTAVPFLPPCWRRRHCAWRSTSWSRCQACGYPATTSW